MSYECALQGNWNWNICLFAWPATKYMTDIMRCVCWKGCVSSWGRAEAAAGSSWAGAESRGAAELGWVVGSSSGKTAAWGGSQTHPAAERTREKHPAAAATVPRFESWVTTAVFIHINTDSSTFTRFILGLCFIILGYRTSNSLQNITGECISGLFIAAIEMLELEIRQYYPQIYIMSN